MGGMLLAYLFFSVLVAAYANLIKRSGLAWLLISLFISPLIAFILLVIIGRPTLPGLFAGLGMKTCPQCAEKVKRAAKICRFCGHTFEEKPKFIPVIDVPELFDLDTHKENTAPLPKKFRTREEYEKWRDEKMRGSTPIG